MRIGYLMVQLGNEAVDVILVGHVPWKRARGGRRVKTENGSQGGAGRDSIVGCQELRIRDLLRRRDIQAEIGRHPFPLAFISTEEEGLVLDNRAAERSSKILIPKRTPARPPAGCGTISWES